MSKEDIDKAVREAEAFAAEDKKKREDVDARNQADQLVFQSKKSLEEFGDKVDASDKSDCEAKIAALEEALKGSDMELIKSKQKELETSIQGIATKVYQQAAAQQQQQDPQGGDQGGYNPGNGGDDNVVDAEFTDAN
jgi:molecular chaperone DnaK